MRIGIIGPNSTVSKVYDIITEEFPEIELLKRTTEFYELSDTLARELQEKSLVDGILFTGPLNFGYVSKRLSPTIPWAYIQHNRETITKGFLEASYHYHSDLKAISVDTYSTDIITELMSDMGITDFVINKPKYEINDSNLENYFYLFHKKCYQEGKATICFTNVEHVKQPLINEGIPCVRLMPAKEIVLEKLYSLQMQILKKSQSAQDNVAVIGVMYNYNYDNEHDLGIRELEKMEYRNSFKQYIYYLAQRLDAAVFSDEVVHYYIITTREKLETIFIKTNEYTNLLNYGKHNNLCKTWIGIGIGKNTLEAKSRANMALNHTFKLYNSSNANISENGAYIVENEFTKKAINPNNKATEELNRISILADQYGLSSETLQRMAQAVQSINKPVTAEWLAQKMGITSRSVNRIIARLEKANIITVVGKETSAKGRPARLLHIALPYE